MPRERVSVRAKLGCSISLFHACQLGPLALRPCALLGRACAREVFEGYSLVASAPGDAAADFRFFAAGLPCATQRPNAVNSSGAFMASPHGDLARSLARACADLARRMPCHNLIFNRSRLCYCGFWVCHKTAHSCFRQHALWLHLPTTLLSITLETTLTTSLAHSLRSPLRALAPERKGVHFFSDRVFANRHPSTVKRTPKKNNAQIVSRRIGCA